MGHRVTLDAMAKRRNPFPAPGEKRIPVVQPVAQSLYGISYLGSCWLDCIGNKWISRSMKDSKS
jgi:hypothetical protein